MRRLCLLLLPAVLGGCALARQPAATVAGPASRMLDGHPSELAAMALDHSLTSRSTQRVAELKNLGGPCATYGSVLETSVRTGRVSVRPFMWRVDGRLVSGEARPEGDIVVARHIDPLNVGVRTVDDVVRTLEHEAAHVAFRVSNGNDGVEDLANTIVQACR